MKSIFIGGFNNTPSQVHGIITQNNNRGLHGSDSEKSTNTNTYTAKENYERYKNSREQSNNIVFTSLFLIVLFFVFYGGYMAYKNESEN